MTDQAYINLFAVNKVFRIAAEEFTALRDISVGFYQHEFTAVVGRSGSGKSTLMNMITGIDKPTSGKVIINNTEIHNLSETKMALWRGENLGIVFQFYQLIPVLSLLENVKLPMQIAGKFTPAEQENRAYELLEMVDLKNMH